MSRDPEPVAGGPESAVLRERVDVKHDGRGWVFEPLGPRAFPAQRNAHVVLSRPGCVRGNHYHERGTEVLTVLGPALVRFRESGRVWDTTVPADQVIRFTIPPGISHAVQNTGTEPTLLVAFNTVEHHPEAPDVVRDELMEG